MRLPNRQGSECGMKQVESEVLPDAGGEGLRSGVINPLGSLGVKVGG